MCAFVGWCTERRGLTSTRRRYIRSAKCMDGAASIGTMSCRSHWKLDHCGSASAQGHLTAAPPNGRVVSRLCPEQGLGIASLSRHASCASDLPCDRCCSTAWVHPTSGLRVPEPAFIKLAGRARDARVVLALRLDIIPRPRREYLPCLTPAISYPYCSSVGVSKRLRRPLRSPTMFSQALPSTMMPCTSPTQTARRPIVFALQLPNSQSGSSFRGERVAVTSWQPSQCRRRGILQARYSLCKLRSASPIEFELGSCSWAMITAAPRIVGTGARRPRWRHSRSPPARRRHRRRPRRCLRR